MVILSQSLQKQMPVLDYLTPSSFIRRTMGKSYTLPSRKVELKADGLTVFPTPIKRLNKFSGQFKEAAQYDFDDDEFRITDYGLWYGPYGNRSFPPDEPFCGFDGSKCPTSTVANYEIAIPLAAVAVSICVGALLFGVRLKRAAEKRLFLQLFKGDIKMSSVILTTEELKNYQYHDSSPTAVTGIKLPLNVSTRLLWKNVRFRRTSLEITKLHHPNIATFYGISTVKDTFSLTWECSHKGSLGQTLSDRSALRDEIIRLSLLCDLLQGISYVHDSPLQYHGSFDPDVCFIDNRYNIKIMQTGCSQLLDSLSTTKSGQSIAHHRLQDIAGFGEISQMFLAYSKDDSMSSDKTAVWAALTYSCLSADLAKRPSITTLKKQFVQFGLPNNVVEYVIKVMGKQTNELESRVRERTEELVEEAGKVDDILMEMLPRTVIIKLRNKEVIVPESFESATILFSDIPEFTELVMHCTPLEAITLLNATHSGFDQAIGQYDCYKVETINDSYMIASGVPIRNGTLHAAEICLLALHLSVLSKAFSVPFRKGQHLVIRIGINAGPVVAGVIGLRMPRYCLFGDTVNCASRMESSGSAGKIHISHDVECLVRSDGRFAVVPRGKVAGKGEMETFWLEAKH
ncbi:guanylate cyclase 2G-like [Paramacrobiotus metropolitanus]|uniref:guanylate cyclase 2G-like n=1 Tax=Paramacrobiotus metropolitanus TaxID=2943436 RepID=UPI00244627A3|nr:guanylate cyclase 2G-like [Paramacrobiotus metropolitanus]